MDRAGYTKTEVEFILPGIFVSVALITCPLTNPAKSYVIKVSNNRLDLSVKGVVVIVYSSSCYKCTLGNFACIREVSYER